MTKQKLILYGMNHKLKDAVHLPTNALTLISDSDIDAYEREFEKEFKTSESIDNTTVREAKDSILEGIRVVFGRESKQYKYIERNIRCEPSLVGNHYQLVPTPYKIREMKEEATAKMVQNGGFTVATGGVDSRSMSEIDDAIKFLISNDFEYGKDFSSHNAVSIANALIPERLEEHITKLPKCPEGEKWEFSKDIYSDSVNPDRIYVNCENECHSQVLNVSYADGVLEIGTNSEEEGYSENV
tara:strand:- start:4950 stop:5675 length:726 start_codon:yes stop_codon:yes gene_type:complete